MSQNFSAGELRIHRPKGYSEEFQLNEAAEAKMRKVGFERILNLIQLIAMRATGNGGNPLNGGHHHCMESGLTRGNWKMFEFQFQNVHPLSAKQNLSDIS
jgi:hypothetical protein